MESSVCDAAFKPDFPESRTLDNAFLAKRYYQRRRLICELVGFSSHQMKEKIKKRRKCRKLWIRPGRTSLWWDNLRTGLSIEE